MGHRSDRVGRISSRHKGLNDPRGPGEAYARECRDQRVVRMKCIGGDSPPINGERHPRDNDRFQGEKA